MDLVLITHGDESGDPGCMPGGSWPYYTEGGFVIREQAQESLRASLSEIGSTFFPDGYGTRAWEKVHKTQIVGDLKNRRWCRRSTTYLTSIIGALAAHDAAFMGSIILKPTEARGRSGRTAVATQALWRYLSLVDDFAREKSATFQLVHDRPLENGVAIFKKRVSQWRENNPACRLVGNPSLPHSTFDPLIHAADHLVGPIMRAAYISSAELPWQVPGRPILARPSAELRTALDRFGNKGEALVVEVGALAAAAGAA